MNIISFYIISAVILIFSVLCVTSRKILRAATYLLFVLIATGCLYFLFQVNFLAAVQIMVYAGGIVVLIIFSILLTSNIDLQLKRFDFRQHLFSMLLSIAGAFITIKTITSYDFSSKYAVNIPSPDVKTFGRSFLSYGENGYVLPFEVITVLLLAVLVSAIMITKKNKI